MVLNQSFLLFQQHFVLLFNFNELLELIDDCALGFRIFIFEDFNRFENLCSVTPEMTWIHVIKEEEVLVIKNLDKCFFKIVRGVEWEDKPSKALCITCSKFSTCSLICYKFDRVKVLTIFLEVLPVMSYFQNFFIFDALL